MWYVDMVIGISQDLMVLFPAEEIHTLWPASQLLLLRTAASTPVRAKECAYNTNLQTKTVFSGVSFSKEERNIIGS